MDEPAQAELALAEKLLRDREARGIIWASRARLVYMTIGAVTTAIAPTARIDFLITQALVAGGLVLVFSSLRLARRRRALRTVGLLGVGYDLVVLFLLPLSWHVSATATHPDLPLSFLLKGDAVIIALTMLAINTLALSPVYPGLFASGAGVQQIIFAALAASDPKSAFTADPVDAIMGAAVQPWFVFWRVLAIALIGTFLVLVTRSVRSLIYEQIASELETRRLREDEAERIAEGKMTALTSLVAGIAHEVNNPLGALSANVDSLRRGAAAVSDGRRAEALRAASEGASSAIDRIHDLVAALRSFAELDQANRQVVDLRSNLDTTLALLPEPVRRDVRVIRRYADAPPVECAPAALNQVFHTILENAFEAIDGDGEVTVEHGPGPLGVRVRVRDSGRGIAPDVLPQLFELRFSTKDRVGMHLGLPTARRIVRDHHGRIAVESEVGRGTTVTIDLRPQPSGGPPSAD